MTRILVVDDSPTIRRVVTHILEVGGFDTVEAVDGQDALDVLKSGDAQSGSRPSRLRDAANEWLSIRARASARS